MSFASDIAKYAKLAGASVDETGRAIVLELFGSVIKDTPVDTGRARGNWQTTIGTPANGQTDRKGEGPALERSDRRQEHGVRGARGDRAEGAEARRLARRASDPADVLEDDERQ